MTASWIWIALFRQLRRPSRASQLDSLTGPKRITPNLPFDFNFNDIGGKFKFRTQKEEEETNTAHVGGANTCSFQLRVMMSISIERLKLEIQSVLFAAESQARPRVQQGRRRRSSQGAGNDRFDALAVELALVALRVR
jgi:hypothetical protein